MAFFAGNSHRTARHARQSHHAAAQAAPWGDSGAVRAFHVARAAAAAAAAAAALLLLLLLLPLLGGSVHGHETFQGAPLFFWSLPPPPPLHSSASLPPPASPLSSSFPPSPVLSGASRRVRAEASCAPPTNVRFPCYDVIQSFHGVICSTVFQFRKVFGAKRHLTVPPSLMAGVPPEVI